MAKKKVAAKHKTSKEGTGEGNRKEVVAEQTGPDPAKPAGITYQTLDKDPTHRADFTFTWSAGDCFNATCTQKHVTISDPADWESQNIVRVSVSDIGLSGMRFHKKVARQFVALFKAVSGTVIKPLTNSGTCVARTITNNEKKLSNHALGTAIDINAAENPYNGTQAKRGAAGSVAEIADKCADFGIYWGGWYSSKKDPMHFEAVKVLDEEALKAACTTHGVDYESTKV
ncbi:MAG: hypothetical protein AMXMBFR64_15960 [Myxococcales bacterium]